MSLDQCPNCGEEFKVVWAVTIGDTGAYKPVFGGPVAFDKARCEKCHLSFERSGDRPWHREGTE